MPVLPENAQELATIAGEIGAEILAGHLRYPSATGVLAFVSNRGRGEPVVRGSMRATCGCSGRWFSQSKHHSNDAELLRFSATFL